VKNQATAPITLRGLFVDNLGLKVTSLVIAMSIFWLVRGSEEAQRSVFVDVVAVTPPNTGENMLTSDLPAKVRLTLRGSRSLLNTLRADTIPPVQVDLSNTSSDLYYFEPEAFELPGGMEVLQIAPPTIPLTWSERGRRSIPVAAQLTGQPASGLMVANTSVRPESLMIRGPAPQLSGLDQVLTSAINLATLPVGRHERRVAIAPLPGHMEVEGSHTLDEVLIAVTIDIAEEVSERTFSRTEVAALGNVRELRPARVRVIVRGAPTLVAAMEPTSVVPYVEASQLDPLAGAQSLAVRVRGLPSGVELVRVEPEEVLVTPSPAHH
jgi:YbbR domain-containing protein